MTGPQDAPGLRSDWLNGWLAAVGATVLVDGLQLSWTDHAVPWARFWWDGDVAEAIYAALLDQSELDGSSIARELDGYPAFTRNIDLDTYRRRCEAERRSGTWHLAATTTDLVVLKDGEPVPHSPFDPPMPQGITIWQRAVACRAAIESAEQVRASLAGTGTTVQLNGLGFDARRLPTGVESRGTVHVDPVVETLAFAALPLSPVRGAGDRRAVRARGWSDAPSKPGAFKWPAWAPPLDRWSIDALLDRFYADERRGVLAVHETVPYRPAGSSDTTRAYAARRGR